MIEAIIFDLGGVLFTNGTKRLAQYIADTYHKDYDVVYQFLNYSDVGNAYREGKITRDDFWKAFEEKFGLHKDIKTIEQKWFDVYEIVEDTKEIITELSQKYKLYFLSDNVKERAEAAEKKYGFLSLFTGGIFSHEVGVRKPNPGIYQLILQKVGMRPEKTLFIDDKEMNLPPAKTLGMNALLFTNVEQFRKDLKSLSLL